MSVKQEISLMNSTCVPVILAASSCSPSRWTPSQTVTRVLIPQTEHRRCPWCNSTGDYERSGNSNCRNCGGPFE